MTTIDDSTAVALGSTSLLLFVVLYVWTALGLSAVFRKSGEQAWKGWVPILNQVVLLQLGGLSGWLFLLVLIPFAGPLILWALLIVACYRINVAFGHGAGLTVVAALLLPLWASILGFGPARWLGPEPLARPHPAGVPASRDGAPQRAVAAGGSESGYVPPASPAAYGAPVPLPGAPVSGWTPPPVPPTAPDGEAVPPAAGAAHGFEPVGFGSEALTDYPSDPPAPPTSARSSAPVIPPFPPLPSAVGSSRWGGFDLGAVSEVTGDVTGADSGASAPVSAVPGASSPEKTSRAGAAVVGVADAGTPRAARESVSAQHTRAQIPGDPVDETIITRPRRTGWSLIPPTGGHVPITADVVILGRKPDPDRSFPTAQLVSIDDGTVSKTHARLELRDEQWYVTDLGSTNGVMFATLMGTEVEATPGVELEAGERFFLGDAEVRLLRSDA